MQMQQSNDSVPSLAAQACPGCPQWEVAACLSGPSLFIRTGQIINLNCIIVFAFSSISFCFCNSSFSCGWSCSCHRHCSCHCDCNRPCHRNRISHCAGQHQRACPLQFLLPLLRALPLNSLSGSVPYSAAVPRAFSLLSIDLRRAPVVDNPRQGNR